MKFRRIGKVLRADSLASECRVMARELEAPGLAGAGKLLSRARASALLQLAANSLEMMAYGPRAYLVVGVCKDDSTHMDRSWVQSVWGSSKDADDMKDQLCLKASLAAAALGNPEMVGLTYEERSAIKDAVRDEDAEAAVGRQGVTWETREWRIG